MGWTEERVELLKKLWNDGLTAATIAAWLGGVTRNAVIGKVHRLGLSGRSKTSSTVHPVVPKVRPRLRAARQAKEAAAVPKEDALVYAMPAGPAISLIELGESTCRWPIDDAQKEALVYCGAPSKKGSSYCPYHTRIAFQPLPEQHRAPALAHA
jgi:GcrA cell cycle regulator